MRRRRRRRGDRRGERRREDGALGRERNAAVAAERARALAHDTTAVAARERGRDVEPRALREDALLGGAAVEREQPAVVRAGLVDHLQRERERADAARGHRRRRDGGAVGGVHEPQPRRHLAVDGAVLARVGDGVAVDAVQQLRVQHEAGHVGGPDLEAEAAAGLERRVVVAAVAAAKVGDVDGLGRRDVHVVDELARHRLREHRVQRFRQGPSAGRKRRRPPSRRRQRRASRRRCRPSAPARAGPAARRRGRWP
mmetsp:Transcript_6945/g.24484  ORF Transcript_6945/g.24484 Transcript_6945/m.24484 type:complete len:255 (-) Transcript_6945:986-1750(-)